ncbi:unnamed protein product [Danaus chrysippus]|uniref:(African queen) hypothetical protein n=1 Tax=Danaus chrysippus TaxID=151541 RepID=A0A8J2VVL0_9NEOP|nr:unnamed protein product [Danaus chrysippus]
MASNIENRLRRIKDSTQDLGRNFFDHINMGIKNFATKNPITDDDIREYEHLVIMKKNPYLDIKDLEINYSPMSPKNVRHSIKMGFDPNLQNEPGICDSIEDVLNVEIINRGLTGFAIPPQLTKHLSMVEEKFKINKTSGEVIPSTNKPMNTNVLTSLDEDITTYIENKNL